MAEDKKEIGKKFEQAKSGLVQNAEQRKALLNQQRMEMGAVARQNQTIKQAAEIAAQTTGQQELGASTEATLKKYGRPSVSRKSNVVTKNPNIIVNNNVTNYNGGAGPTQGRQLVVRSPGQQDSGMAKFKAWLSGVFAKQNEDNSKREREFRKQDGYLSRTSSKLMKRLETFGSSVAEQMNPKRIAAAMGSQMKTLLFLFGAFFLAANWTKILDSIGKIANTVSKVADFFTGGKDGRISGFKETLIKLLGGDVNKKGGVIGAFSDLFKASTNAIGDFFKKEWEIRSAAVKQVKLPPLADTKGDFVKILSRIGDYLVDVLTCLTTGSKGVQKSISRTIRANVDKATNQKTADGAWVNKKAVYTKNYKRNVWMGDAASAMGGNTLIEGDVENNYLTNNTGASVRQARNIGALIKDNKTANVGGVMVGMERLKNTAVRKGSVVVPGDFFNNFSYLGIPASSLENLTKSSKVGRYKYVIDNKTEEDFALEGLATGKNLINDFLRNKAYDAVGAGFIERGIGNLSGLGRGYSKTEKALAYTGIGLPISVASNWIRNRNPLVQGALTELIDKPLAAQQVLRMVPIDDPRPAQEINTPNGKKTVFEMLEVSSDQIKTLEGLIRTRTGNKNFEFSADSEGSMASLGKAIQESLAKRGYKNVSADYDTKAYDRMRELENFENETNKAYNEKHFGEGTILGNAKREAGKLKDDVVDFGTGVYNDVSGYVNTWINAGKSFWNNTSTRTGAIIKGNAPIYKQRGAITGAGAKNNNPGNNTGSNPFSVSSKGVGGSGNKHHTLYRNLEDGYAGNVWTLLRYMSGKSRWMSANPTLRNILSTWVDGQPSTGKQMSNERIAKYEKDSGIKADTHIPLTKDNLLRLVLTIGKWDSSYVNPPQAAIAVERAWDLWEKTNGKINTSEMPIVDIDNTSFPISQTQNLTAFPTNTNYGYNILTSTDNGGASGTNFFGAPSTSSARAISPIGSGNIVITSGFGGRVSPEEVGSTNHKGIDIRVQFAPVFATEDNGVIVAVGDTGNKGYGKFIKVRYNRGNGTVIETTYGHLSSINVRPGQTVVAGDVIGISGNSGSSTGPHLHFEVALIDEKGNKTRINPVEYLANLAQSGGVMGSVSMKNGELLFGGNLSNGLNNIQTAGATSTTANGLTGEQTGAWNKATSWFKEAENLVKKIQNGTAKDEDVVSLMNGMRDLYTSGEIDLIAGKKISDEEREIAIKKLDSVKDLKSFMEAQERGFVEVKGEKAAFSKEEFKNKYSAWFKEGVELYKKAKGGTAKDEDVVSHMKVLRDLYTSGEIDLINPKKLSDEDKKLALERIDSINDVKSYLESIKNSLETKIDSTKDEKENLSLLSKQISGGIYDGIVKIQEKELGEIKEAIETIKETKEEPKKEEKKEESKKEEKKEPEKKKEKWEIELDKLAGADAKTNWERLKEKTKESHSIWGDLAELDTNETAKSRRMRKLVGPEKWSEFREKQLEDLRGIIGKNYKSIKLLAEKGDGNAKNILNLYSAAAKNPYSNAIEKLETALFSLRTNGVSGVVDDLRTYRQGAANYAIENFSNNLSDLASPNNIEKLNYLGFTREEIDEWSDSEEGSVEKYNRTYGLLGFNPDKDLKEKKDSIVVDPTKYGSGFRVLRTEDEAKAEHNRYKELQDIAKKGKSATADEIEKLVNNLRERIDPQKDIADFWPIYISFGATYNNGYGSSLAKAATIRENFKKKKEHIKVGMTPEKLKEIEDNIRIWFGSLYYSDFLKIIKRAELNKKSDITKRNQFLNKTKICLEKVNKLEKSGESLDNLISYGAFEKIYEAPTYQSENGTVFSGSYSSFGGEVVGRDANSKATKANKELQKKLLELRNKLSYYTSGGWKSLKAKLEYATNSKKDKVPGYALEYTWHPGWWKYRYVPETNTSSSPKRWNQLFELINLLEKIERWKNSDEATKKKMLLDIGTEEKTAENILNLGDGALGLFMKSVGETDETLQETLEKNNLNLSETRGLGPSINKKTGKLELERDKNGNIIDSRYISAFNNGQLDETGRTKVTLFDGDRAGKEVYATEKEYSEYLEADETKRQKMYEDWINKVKESKKAYNLNAFKYLGSDVNGKEIGIRLVKLQDGSFVQILDSDYEEFKKVINDSKLFNDGMFTGDGLKKVNEFLNNYTKATTGKLKYFTKDESGNWVETDEDTVFGNDLNYKVGKYGEEKISGVDEEELGIVNKDAWNKLTPAQKKMYAATHGGAKAGGILNKNNPAQQSQQQQEKKKKDADRVKASFKKVIESQVDIAAETQELVSNAADSAEKTAKSTEEIKKAVEDVTGELNTLLTKLNETDAHLITAYEKHSNVIEAILGLHQQD